MLKEFKRIFKDKKLRENELKKTAVFFGLFAGVFLIELFLIYFVLPLNQIEMMVAQTTGTLLAMQGINSTLLFVEHATLLLDTGQKIIFTFLCTGLFETALITSLILASKGIDAWKRIAGAVIAVAAVQVFNFLRIIITVNAIVSQNIEAAVLVHDVFFRMGLLFAIVGIYFVWFFFSTK